MPAIQSEFHSRHLGKYKFGRLLFSFHSTSFPQTNMQTQSSARGCQSQGYSPFTAATVFDVSTSVSGNFIAAIPSLLEVPAVCLMLTRGISRTLETEKGRESVHLQFQGKLQRIKDNENRVFVVLCQFMMTSSFLIQPGSINKENKYFLTFIQNCNLCFDQNLLSLSSIHLFDF